MTDAPEATIAIIRAVAGDLTAWDALQGPYDAVLRAAALLILAPNPPPLAMLAAFARIGESASAGLR